MRLYLDDDSIFPVLVKLLRQAGHDVLVPADLGIAGADDPVHLRHAIRIDRVLLSHNYEISNSCMNSFWKGKVTIQESFWCEKTTIPRGT